MLYPAELWALESKSSAKVVNPARCVPMYAGVAKLSIHDIKKTSGFHKFAVGQRSKASHEGLLILPQDLNLLTHSLAVTSAQIRISSFDPICPLLQGIADQIGIRHCH